MWGGQRLGAPPRASLLPLPEPQSLLQPPRTEQKQHFCPLRQWFLEHPATFSSGAEPNAAGLFRMPEPRRPFPQPPGILQGPASRAQAQQFQGSPRAMGGLRAAQERTPPALVLQEDPPQTCPSIALFFHLPLPIPCSFVSSTHRFSQIPNPNHGRDMGSLCRRVTEWLRFAGPSGAPLVPLLLQQGHTDPLVPQPLLPALCHLQAC